MTESAQSEKHGIGDWISGFVIVVLLLAVGLLVAGAVGVLVPRFPGLMGLQMCITAMPLVWLAKRCGGLADLDRIGFLTIAFSVIAFDWIVDVFNIGGQALHLVGSLTMGIATRLVQKQRREASSEPTA